MSLISLLMCSDKAQVSRESPAVSTGQTAPSFLPLPGEGHGCASPCLSLELSSVRAGTVLPWGGAVPTDAPAVQPLSTKAVVPGRCAGTTTAQHRTAQMASEEFLPQTCILGCS